MPKTNKELEVIKMALANYDLGRSFFKYDKHKETKAGNQLPELFIVNIIAV